MLIIFTAQKAVTEVFELFVPEARPNSTIARMWTHLHRTEKTPKQVLTRKNNSK